jgi:retinol dehydrogenase-14
VRTVLITGGNTGIGKATAIALARRGDDVIITSRNADKGARAADEIRRASGRRVTVLALDLASIASIERFTDELMAIRGRLEVTILNAGLLVTERRTTEDGFEEMFGVNHLGHFLLTHRLLPMIRRSTPARILVVSSRAHRRPKHGLDFDDLMNVGAFDPLVVYGQSKLANIYFARELSRRLEGSGVVVHALHPGVVATEFAGDDDARGLANLYFRFGRPFLRTPAEGAETTIFLATSDAAMRSTGLYYGDSKPADPTVLAQDDAQAARLWTASEALLGLAS